MSKKIHLIVIDPQNDFCDAKNGSLYVKGADKDMERLSAMVNRIPEKLYDITTTLDSHHTIHVAHPIYWRNSNGDHPTPFTIISAKDVRDGVWLPTNPGWLKHTRDNFGALDYVESLEKNGRPRNLLR
jgi:nicotinamidase/pyrazinamidase